MKAKELLSQECNRYTNGECRTFNCIRRAGWIRGPYDPNIATCEYHEAIKEIEILESKIEKLDEENENLIREIEY